MRILLVNPYWTFYPGTNRRLGGPPSTLAVVAAALRSHANVSIFDFMASNRITETGDTLTCGKSLDDFSQVLDGIDAVGFSSTWTVQHPNTLALAEFVRAHNSSIRLFVGGHHPTVVSEDSSKFDFIVTGEVENVVGDIIANIKNTKTSVIKGYPVADLNTIHFPAYDLLDLDFYHEANRNHHGSLLRGGIPVITSRGCPYACSFCTVHLSMGRKWRANSPEYIKWHLQRLHDLGFTKFHFEDDNLMLDRDRWIQVMTAMIGHGYQWDTPNGVRLDSLTPKMLNLAKLSGCTELRISVETANDYVRNKVVGKNLSLSTLYQVAEKCRELDIRLGCFFVVGIPGETLEDMRNTLRLATELEDHYGVIPRYSVATPFPGTEMLQDCIERGWLTVPYPYTTEQLAGATHGKGLIKTDEFTPEDINVVYTAWKERRL